jgi:hypothetical protein
MPFQVEAQLALLILTLILMKNFPFFGTICRMNLLNGSGKENKLGYLNFNPNLGLLFGARVGSRSSPQAFTEGLSPKWPKKRDIEGKIFNLLCGKNVIAEGRKSEHFGGMSGFKNKVGFWTEQVFRTHRFENSVFDFRKMSIFGFSYFRLF